MVLSCDVLLLASCCASCFLSVFVFRVLLFASVFFVSFCLFFGFVFDFLSFDC